MIQHVYERAGKAATLKRLVLATDDSRIREAALRFGVEVLMTSADHGSGTDRVAEAARRLSLPPDAVVVNIQGDEPLLQPEVIDQLVQALVAAPDVPMATLAHQGLGRTDFRDPGVVKVVFDTRKQAIYFSRARFLTPGERRKRRPTTSKSDSTPSGTPSSNTSPHSRRGRSSR